ncbi:Ppx/GppA phosphatase family protein [Flavobacterium sp. CF136]|uniref:Ppx/GppA phosphatase family protein n=1 Tax=Flavobacterium sp. (strain CF136) TaxID=1144313 RepID=UPI0002719F93|nr:exopolyphosphatase [Flavobacterium sp. CF136]EJL62642.1 exopolyphosphatase [Flavobacterium sp. CF136]
MKNILSNKNCLFLFLLLISFTVNSQTLYGGIEIGSKGIKMTIINVKNAKKGLYEIKESWTENAGIATGISINGNLAQSDMEIATDIVLKNYKIMLEHSKIKNENIFIVASSGVGMAKNTDELVAIIKAKTDKDLPIITSQQEGKMLLEGCIPPKKYLNSMILDIGSGNTKGGYVNAFNGGNNIFFPLSLNIGTVTLTEKINKKEKKISITEFNERSFEYLPVLRNDFAKMYAGGAESLKKENVYLSGGAVWAFYTLFNEGKPPLENFTLINFEDIITNKNVIENNFSKIKALSITNTEVKKVIEVYTQEQLISANNILISLLENIPNIQNKKIYFAKQGQVAWLISYITNKAKVAKPIY